MPFHLTKILVVVINFILNARIYNSNNIKFLPKEEKTLNLQPDFIVLNFLESLILNSLGI